MTSTVPAQKAALVRRLRDLFPEAGVSYAMPSTFPNDCAYLGPASVETTQPTEGSYRRSRRETVRLTVVFTCYRTGLAADDDKVDLQEESGVLADEASYAMLTALEDDFRNRQSDPLDGLVMTAIVSEHDTDTGPVLDNSGAIVGYISEITATVTTTAVI